LFLLNTIYAWATTILRVVQVPANSVQRVLPDDGCVFEILRPDERLAHPISGTTVRGDADAAVVPKSIEGSRPTLLDNPEVDNLLVVRKRDARRRHCNEESTNEGTSANHVNLGI
jgi:hypothetical protein